LKKRARQINFTVTQNEYAVYSKVADLRGKSLPALAKLALLEFCSFTFEKSKELEEMKQQYKQQYIDAWKSYLAEKPCSTPQPTSARKKP